MKGEDAEETRVECLEGIVGGSVLAEVDLSSV